MRHSLFSLLIVSATSLHAQWTLIPSGTTTEFETVDFWGNTGLLQGGVVLRSTDGGYTWGSTAASPGLYQDVCFADATTAYLAGAVSMAMYKSTNGGSTWSQLTPPTSNSLWGVSAPTASHVYFVGTGAVVWESTNGGLSFNIRDNDVASGNNVDVDFVSENVGFTATEPRDVFKTVNGGMDWTLAFHHPTSCVYRGISFLDADHGCVVGGSGAVAVTTDGGDNWTVPAAVTGSYLQNVHFADAQNGMAVGMGGAVIRTTDGGTTWFAEPSFTTNDLGAVHMFSATSAMVAGAGGVIYRNDALPTGIHEQAANSELTTYVDLASQTAQIQLPAAWISQALTLELFDAAGGTVLVLQATGENRMSVDLRQLSAGAFSGMIRTSRGEVGWFRFIR